MSDYIKREDIIKWIDDSIEQYGDRYETNMLNMMDLFRTVVNDCLPTADVVARKTGEWVNVWHNSFRAEVQMCSNCKGISAFKTNFCPNCGAEMKGESQ